MFTYRDVVQNRILQHILFWIASFVVLVYIFKVSVRPAKIDFIYTFFFMLPLVGVVYVNSILLIPRVLSRRYYIQYVFWLALLFFLGSFFYLRLFVDWIDVILPDYFFVAYYNAFDYLLFLGIFLFVSSLLKLAKSWFKMIELEKENQRYALKALQSKVNPHFFFNSLNTLYGMSLKKDADLPETILSLSDLMRYSLYEADKEKVSLDDEVRFLRNYMHLQRRRISKPEAVTFNVIGDVQEEFVAPHIFLSFIENAFKHHGDSKDPSFVIFVELRVEKSKLCFKCQNSVLGNIVSGNGEGLGLENTKRRLKHLYPGKHQIKIIREDKLFSVYLDLIF